MLGKLLEKDANDFVREDLFESIGFLDDMWNGVLDQELNLAAIDPVVVANLHEE
jgi:hypothetical protein